ncbi:MAG TPA: FtsX-like permease family protein [Bryobacteraceae bacterium]|nr:FtsX-like permease family protein [Bryobacteraceae bacterium]
MAVVGLVLLIACTNIAGLLLARGAARQKEMAVRISLGAGRRRLLSQGLIESLLLAGLGGLLGIFLANFGAGALIRLLLSGRQMPGMPQHLDLSVRPDAHVLWFTAGLALLTALVFGLAPAWSAFTSAPACSLQEIGRAGDTRSRRLFGKALVVAQVGLSLVLLTAAGLFVGHLSNLEHMNLGFRRDHVLLVTLDPSRPESAGAYQGLLSRLEASPGVTSASLSAPTPLSGAGASGLALIEGRYEKPEDRRFISISWVSPKYFGTLGVPLLAGRDFKFEDQANARVAILSESTARYYFAGGDPLGQHITLDHVTGGGEPRSYEIVGVAGDANYYEIREPSRRTVYLPAFQDGRVVAQNLVLRTSIAPNALAETVRRVVRDVLRSTTVARVVTLSDQIDASIVPERLMATLSGSFGMLGLLLAVLGLYGLLAYAVARRTAELAIRLALGATPGSLIRLVIQEALTVTSAGLFLGAAAVLWTSDIAASLVPDVQMVSIAPLSIGAAVMLGIALLAAFLPARRAARVDPIETLRHQ